MPPNRSPGRNVHFYDARDPEKALGGLVRTNGITNCNFYSMLEILLICEEPFSVRNQHKILVEKDDHPLQPGKYYITGSFSMTEEPSITRATSIDTGTHLQSFRDSVRLRDRRCVISGQEAADPDHGFWMGIEAAHIVPLAFQSHWVAQNFTRWITIPATGTGPAINSVQNGLLLNSGIHQLFDSYLVSINPDDKYKIVSFRGDGNGMAGNFLDQYFLNKPDRPVDQLLRWHFRQAVLTNMRGAGEPAFETDFPPGSDMIGEILAGPKPAERMEFELFSRLISE